MSDAIDNPNWHETTADAVDTQWLDAIGIAWKRITGRPWDTLDGETREEGLDANVGALFDELTDWKARAEKAEVELDRVSKACAERWALLLKFKVAWATGRVATGVSAEAIDHAMSTDAGHDYHHRDEFKPILLLLGETMDHVPSELRSRIVSAVAETKAKGLL